MQLTLSALSKKSPFPLTEILSAITTCKCNILEWRTSQFSPSIMATYALVEGDWHCLAKLENSLDNLQKRSEIKIHTLQVEPENRNEAYIPYSLKSISLDHPEMIQEIVIFLTTHAIIVQDIKASCYPAPYTDSPLFATEFIILIHEGIQLLSFREELLSFCDSLNLDAIFEPLKR